MRRVGQAVALAQGLAGNERTVSLDIDAAAHRFEREEREKLHGKAAPSSFGVRRRKLLVRQSEGKVASNRSPTIHYA
jgi:hypothetical protein